MAKYLREVPPHREQRRKQSDAVLEKLTKDKALLEKKLKDRRRIRYQDDHACA